MLEEKKYKHLTRQSAIFIMVGAICLVKNNHLKLLSYFCIAWGLILLLRIILSFKDFESNEDPNTPQFIFLGFIVSLHFILSLIFDAIFIFIISSILAGFIKNYLILILSISIGVFFSRFYFTNTLIKSLKTISKSNYRILLLRHFSEEDGIATKQYTAPVFGAYGQIDTVADETLNSSKDGINPDSEIIISQIHNATSYTNSNWKQGVSNSIKKVNLTVFQWEREPTESMIWELDEAKKILTINKIVFTCSTKNASMLRKWLENYDSNDYPIIINKRPKIGYFRSYLSFSTDVWSFFKKLNRVQ